MVNFTTSTNIVRDVHNDIQYIPTPNAINVFKRLASGYQTGLHSFNIIGSYGTGKSSFLWALEKNLHHRQSVFEPLNGQFKGVKNFLFIKIVGESDSFIAVFNEKLGLPPNSPAKKTFARLQEVYNDYNNTLDGRGVLFLVVDEFGKFLEYAAKNNPEKNFTLFSSWPNLSTIRLRILFSSQPCIRTLELMPEVWTGTRSRNGRR